MSAKEEIVKKSTTSAPKDKAEVEPSVASQAPEETANGRQGADTAPPVAAEEPTEPALAAQEVEELKARAAKADEHWDRLLRTTADLENFKKRATREKQEAIKFANEGLLVKLLPALDNFDMALAAADSAEGTRVDSLKTGITMVYHQLKSALAESGLEEIDAANQPFNPNLHEAVSQEESSEVPEGHVIRQLRKGYKLRDRLIRPASVVVARKPAA